MSASATQGGHNNRPHLCGTVMQPKPHGPLRRMTENNCHCKTMSGYDCWNRYDFSCWQNVSKRGGRDIMTTPSPWQMYGHRQTVFFLRLSKNSIIGMTGVDFLQTL